MKTRYARQIRRAIIYARSTRRLKEKGWAVRDFIWMETNGMTKLELRVYWAVLRGQR